MALGNSEAYTVKYVPIGIDAQLTGLNSKLSTRNAGGIFSKKYGVALVKDNIIDLLTTRRGDRVMLPDYGTAIHMAVFEELDSYLRHDIESTILRSIAIYEPRVDVNSLEISIINDQAFFTLPASDVVGLAEESKILISLTVSLKEDALATEFINIAF